MNESIANALFGPGCPWYSWFERFGPANVKWCEETICSWTNEPANAWSNVAFFIAAFLIYKKTPLKKYALSVFLMGLGSFFFHASNNYFSQIIDFVGMYVWACYLLNLNLLRLQWIPEKEKNYWYFGWIVFFTVLIPLCRLIHFPYQNLIVILGLLIILTELKCAKVEKDLVKNYKPLLMTLVIIIIAETLSLLDLTRVICDPKNHFIQGHAVWHVLCALATYCSASFYTQVIKNETT